MAKKVDPADVSGNVADNVAGEVLLAIGLLHRRMRQSPISGELSLPQRAALSRLDRSGPMTSAALARLEQVSPQAMGNTLGGLEQAGLINRLPDPGDRRQIVLSLTAHGRAVLAERRSARLQQLAAILADDFSPAELAALDTAAPLLKRLADRL